MGNKWSGILKDLSRTGEPFWLDTTIIPIRDEKDKTIKYLSTYNDVTKFYKTNTKLFKSELIKTNLQSKTILIKPLLKLLYCFSFFKFF